MARINVDEEIFSDPRFRALVRRLGGCEDHALGLVVRWWSVSQKWWGKDGRQLVPDDQFQLGDFDHLAVVGLAEKRDTGWYAKGSEERFSWYADICDRGRHGVEKRAQKKANRGVVPTGQPVGQPTGSKKPGKRQPRGQPSFIYNAANSETPVDNSFSETPLALGPSAALTLQAATLMATDPDKDKPTGKPVWEAYRAAYVARYKVEPARNKTVNSQITALVKRLGLESAVEVVGFYVSHNDQFYTRKQHPIGLCLSDAEGLYTQWRTGRQMTSTQARQTDETQSNINAAQGAMDILMGRKGSILVTRE